MDFEQVSDSLLKVNDPDIFEISSLFFQDKNLSGFTDWIVMQTGCDIIVAEGIAAYNFLNEQMKGGENYYDIVVRCYESNNNQEFINFIQEKTGCSNAAADIVIDFELVCHKELMEEMENPPTPKCSKCNSTSIATVNDISLVGTGAPINICQNCGYRWEI